METTLDTRNERNGLDSDNPPLCSIRWSAVVAGLIVGLGVHLVLMLLGLAAGLAVFGSGGRPDGESVSAAAVIWNSLSLISAAAIGGYIAARSSGLRRTADGMLHAVASWGASMICYIFLVSMLTGNTVGSLFGIAATTTGTAAAAQTAPGEPNTTVTELLASIERGDREAAVQILRERFGMSDEQANQAIERALAVFGQTPLQSDTVERLEDAAQAASAASAWLSLVVLLSLAAGAGAGVIGARGTRKRMVTTGYRSPMLSPIPVETGLPRR
ncbi:MAG: hypothetical protein QM739_06225 [Propionivibrio sp.]